MDDECSSSGTAVSPPPVDVSDPKYSPQLNPSQLFSAPDSRFTPQSPTTLLSPFATGQCSELFKCVVKKPDVVQLEINGELVSNAKDVTAQFLAELTVYSTVTRHRNIVSFLGCLEGVGLVLEYIEGRSLLQVLRQRPQVSKKVKVDYHNQLLDGLAHVHSFGMSHAIIFSALPIGDLSLQNIMIAEPAGTIKIFDFGRSTIVRQSFSSPDPRDQPLYSVEGTIHPGTRPFTAPEILRGECQDSILADAYSFGIILLCIDRGGLVNIDIEQQKKDIPPNLFGLEVFFDVIEPYLRRWSSRERISKATRIRLPQDADWKD